MARRKALRHDASTSSASAQDERSDAGTDRIIPNKNRRLQVAPTRRKLFDAEAQDAFLEHFAATCNCALSARRTGFHYRTVIRHWREDPGFAARCEDTLKIGYARLEELALRAAAAALTPRRPPTDPDRPMRAAEIPGMDAAMALQLLREHKRMAGRCSGSGPGGKPGAPPTAWTFDEAIAELDRKLRAMGARHGVEAEPVELPRRDRGPAAG